MRLKNGLKTRKCLQSVVPLRSKALPMDLNRFAASLRDRDNLLDRLRCKALKIRRFASRFTPCCRANCLLQKSISQLGSDPNYALASQGRHLHFGAVGRLDKKLSQSPAP